MLSAVLVPPRTKDLAPATAVMLPLIVRAPVPLALRYALTVVVLMVIGLANVAAAPVYVSAPGVVVALPMRMPEVFANPPTSEKDSVPALIFVGPA